MRGEDIPVQTAANGTRAIEMLAAQRYRLVVLDLMMPVSSGFDVIDHLAREGDTTPVIVMTGIAKPLDRPFTRNVQALLRKPLDLSQLIKLVQAMR